MARVPKTDLHRLYHLEIIGDALVVSPQGDAAGFSTTEANSEITNALAVAQQDHVKHLVVDLSRNAYFGSIVIGALVQLGQTVRDRGGRIALCGASPQMQDVLRLLKLDEMWESFPTKWQALSAMTRIPLIERVSVARGRIAALAVVLACVAVYYLMPRPDYARQYYPQVSQMWREVQAKQATVSDLEWTQVLQDQEERLTPMIRTLSSRYAATGRGEGERSLLYALRDHWMDALSRVHPDTAALHSQFVQHYLRCVEAELEHRQPPSLPDELRSKTVDVTQREWHSKSWVRRGARTAAIEQTLEPTLKP